MRTGGVAADEAYCNEALPRVSRTFALGIASLPDELRLPTTAGYLLCRISDAIEDQTSLAMPARRAALVAWRREVILGARGAKGAPAGIPTPLQGALPALPEGGEWPAGLVGTSDADTDLLAHRVHVLGLLASLPSDVATLVAARTCEMAEGMGELLQDGATHPIATWDDLERYCYYVAGTVGHMLTGLFLVGHDASNAQALAERATSFGTGLQLVNIAKDAAGDLVDGRCFLPREAWPEGFTGRPGDGVPDTLRAPLLEIVARARRHLTVANAYLLALPHTAVAARKFCGMALHLAMRTLTACEAADTLTDPRRPPKVSRAEVMETVAWLDANARDDVALAARFADLAG